MYALKIAGPVETAGMYLRPDWVRFRPFYASEIADRYSRTMAYKMRRIALRYGLDPAVRVLVVKIDG
jgi:hypothetical protein